MIHEECSNLNKRINHNRSLTWYQQDRLNVTHTRASAAKIKGCNYGRWVNNLWIHRKLEVQKRANYFVLPNTKDWESATKIVQRIFPNTASWLWSCSGAEGGHGDFVRYGGNPYYAGYEYTDAVGGNLQFRPSTFKGAFRHAYEYATSKGFIIPLLPNDWINQNHTVQKAWLSPLGQALAGAYLRTMGHSHTHWSASISTGCA